jgi:hypothetical protein
MGGSRGSANDKFRIEVEIGGMSVDQKVHMPHEGHLVKRAGHGVDVPELSTGRGRGRG